MKHPPPTPSPPPAPPTEALLLYRLRILAGALLLALYVTVLARNDLDAAMGRGALPALPGGWKGLAALLVLGLVILTGVAAWGRGWRLATAGRWALAHPAVVAVVGITALAAGLRLLGISDNLPYVSYPDEPAVADRALGILQTGDYNPHYFVYPNLYTYLQAAVYVLRFFALVSGGAITRLDQIVPTDFYLWGRLLTALLGTVTVPLVYLAGRRLYGATVGVVAAAFMATNTVHILHSQLITTDAPAAFFGALALLAIVRLLPPGAEGRDTVGLASVGRYLVAGTAVGLAIGTKYNSALVALPLLLAHGMAVAATPGPRLGRFFGGRLWAALAALVGAFVLTTPFALLDLPHFLDELASVVAHYRTGHTGHEGDSNWLFYVQSFLDTDFWPTVLALAGVAFAVLRRRRADVLILAFPLVFYLSMSSYRVNFERNLLPLLPFTSILGALALVAGWRAATAQLRRMPQRADRQRLAVAAQAVLVVLVTGAVLGPTVAAAQRGYLHAQPDTRVRAAAWFDHNTRPGTKIWLEAYTPDLPAGRYLTGHGAHVTDHPPEWYIANRYEYVVLSAGAYKESVSIHPDADPALHAAYVQFFATNEARRAVAFEQNDVDQPGPTIQIYRTGYTPPQSAAEIRPQQPLTATFQGPNGGIMHLLGADVPLTATVGSTLPLMLYWQASPPLKEDYTVFIHLTDTAGGRPAQRDVGPRSGTYPTSQWQEAEIVLDETGVDLPPTLAPGTYTLHVGLYVQREGQFFPALPVTGGPPGGGGDYVLLGPITVQP